MKEIIEKIKELTANDLKHKTKEELFLSLIEEIGELSKEILIAEKVYGNTYKKPDEGPTGESVDLFICAIAMQSATENRDLEQWEMDKITFHNSFYSTTNPIYIINMIAELLNPNENNYLKIASLSCAIHYYYSEDKHNSKQEFINYCNKKLDKWIEKTNIKKD